MIRTEDIRSLTDFRQNAKEHLAFYWSLPIGQRHFLPVENALQSVLGNEAPAAFTEGEQLDVRGLVRASQGIAEQLRATDSADRPAQSLP